MSEGKLSRTTMILYAVPTIGLNAMHWLVMILLLKYSTDTLRISPAVVGGIFAAGRIWDGVSDPIAGWLSDRTQVRFGRRRSWMLAAAIPVGLSYYGFWSAPVNDGSTASAMWLAFALITFFTASTAVKIPYLSLGAELTPDHHERTRISAFRVGAETLGIFLALSGVHFIENVGSMRESARWVAMWLGGMTTLLIIVSALALEEPAAHQGRGAQHPFGAMRDVLRNPHALRLTIAICLAELGLGSLLVALPFLTEHMGEPGTTAPRMLSFILPFAISVPIWIPLSRRHGKPACLCAATGICALSFLAMGLGAWEYAAGGILATGFIGFSQAALRTFPESIKADVIDWDEAHTGERKEGTYFAAWNLSDKLAGALSVAIVGFAIQGTDGNVDPARIPLVISYLPAAFLVASMVVLMGFRLGAREHARVRQRIDVPRGKEELAMGTSIS